MADENDYYSDDLQGDEGFLTDDSEERYGDGYGEPSRHYDDDPEDNVAALEEIRETAMELCWQVGDYDYADEDSAEQDNKFYTGWTRGPQALSALRSLRKLWKLDDDDPTRKVARAFVDCTVLPNFLLPALLESAGKDPPMGDAIVLACTDLLAAMTWPFDSAAELRELSKQGLDYDDLDEITKLDQKLIVYKSAILRCMSLDKQHDVLGVVMRYLLLPKLTTKKHQRTSLENGIISMCLHLIRNLLAIRDPITTSLSSVEQLSYANLQSELILSLKKHHILDALLMLASSAETSNFNDWNAIASECIFHIFVGTKVKEIAEVTSGSASRSITDTSEAARTSSRTAATATSSGSSSALAESLAMEAKIKRASASGTIPTRHSRFGTTINFVGPDGLRRVARNQSALAKSVAQLADEAMHKGKRRAQRRKNAQEQGAPKLKAKWTADAALVLQDWADAFVQAGFEPLAKSVLKDIRSERDKLGDLDVARVRIMQLGTFFLEYFLSRRAAAAQRRKAAGTTAPAQPTLTQETADLLEPQQHHEAEKAQSEQPAEGADGEWPFELVSQWLEPWAFRMVLVRTIQAQESKAWLEFVAAVQLWTVLLRLVDELASSKKESERDVAEGLQAEFYYMSETLDACHAVVRSYTAQSFAFLETIIGFAYYMPKMLERYASNRDHMYVQAKKQVRRSRQDGDLDADEDEAAQIKEQLKETRSEREFRFADFQRKLATKQLTTACSHYLSYLSGWHDYGDTDEQLNKLVTVMHRIAIKANDYRQFFLAGLRSNLRSVISGNAMGILEARAPTSAPTLKKLIDYILRKFSKLSPEEQSIYDTGKRPPRQPKPPRMPAEIAVRPGMAPDEEIGVAVGLLLKKEKMQAVLWVKSALEMASAMRTELVARHEEDGTRRQSESSTSILGEDAADDDSGAMLLGELEKQNESPVERFQPFELAYRGNDELRTDASLLPELKLLCRLVGLEANDDELVHWKWTVPKEILPEHLDEKVEAIERFIREPLDTHGRELTALVMRMRKPRVGGEDNSDVTNSADLPDGWNGALSESDEDGDYFDRVRASRSLVTSEGAAADGGLLRSSGAKKRSKPTANRGGRKQMRRTEQEFLNDSDEEWAFAMAEIEHDDEERKAAEDSSSDEHGDGIDERETPPTSSVVDDVQEEQAVDDAGKQSALQALRTAQQKRSKTTKEPLQDARQRTNRRVDTKRLFLADSDEEEALFSSQELEQNKTELGQPLAPTNLSSGFYAKKRSRLAILDDEDEDEE
ncbi:related to TOF1-topoisomerase I interacting factor 1 [Sporisorium reilianum SRZ2]|uniref:Related to TOF1-topoisomerase I interacting factor 1 n=1 Tax=Sporisorium reilianum (strain SRZ2) TaxID=999809 RepID=E7A1J3_SPORE|nr:related to TOF1-topoisomerase I interacting factor 1 [Sporisorium reilianum SRZ2]